MKVNRHVCREFALQTLYNWEFYGRSRPLLSLLSSNNQHFFLYSDQKIEFALTILQGIEKHLHEIEQAIEKYAPEWPIDKIATLDKCVLYIGIYELLFNEEVPDVVAINESVELAKHFGSDTSSKFVNGVLNTMYKSLKLSKES